MRTNIKILILLANIIFVQFRWLNSREKNLNCDNKTGHYPSGIVELFKIAIKWLNIIKDLPTLHKPSGVKVPTSHNVNYTFMVEIKNKSDRQA